VTSLRCTVVNNNYCQYLDLPGLGQSSPSEDDVTHASASATDDVIDF